MGQVEFISTKELLEGSWCQETPGSTSQLLCMPGGADLPYCRDLNGRGNALIRGAAGKGTISA